MVAIQPFRALRYNPDRIADLSEVIAPPYDVIDPEQQEQLYQASPYNVVRLILGKQYPNDTSTENRYTRAQRDFKAWQDNQILSVDAAPALYLIAHTFRAGETTHCRLGFIALISLDEQVRGSIHRHEETLAAPKQDRTKLLEAVPANLEPIFCIYPDEGGSIQAMLEELIARQTPLAQALINGEGIRVWALTDSSLIERIREHLASVAVLIADGHHRFEVGYANRQRYGALMSYFVSMADPALILRPIHRLIQSGGPQAQTVQMLCAMEAQKNLPELTAWLGAQEGQGCFGYCEPSGIFGATIKPEVLARWLMNPSLSRPIAGLDVAILHGMLLGQEAVVRYTADSHQALQAIQRGEAASAWLLRPISLTHVYALASQGVTLPPKSTYFYPKVPSGLTMNLLQC